MNILLAGQAYYREDNGQAVFTVRLARGLHRQGHTVSVLAPAEPDNLQVEAIEGVQVLRVPTLRLPHNANITLKALAKLRKRLVAPEHFDIIHLQDHYFISRALWRLAKEQHIPVVGTNHFLPQNLTANIPLPIPLRHRLEPLFWRHMLSLYNKLEAVSTPTQTAADILLQQGIRPPVTAISCGVDVERFKPDMEARRKIRQRLGVDDAAPLFLYVGRLDHEKGLREVVSAFAQLKKDSAVLTLAGNGSCAIELREQVEQLNLGKQVLFPGYVSNEDLPKLYNAADCFIMAGYAELQSIATLEAMACGLPVLAADACALPELVTHGENGLLFAARSAESLVGQWRDFFRLRPQWQEMGMVGRAKAETHSLIQSVAHYVAWYAGVLAQTTASPAVHL
ncbi:MAG: glycosyltransferase [Desulfobulbaceae bacterium]|nr:glycosyltransferase [Desulfobulbaceae bacterium]